MQVLMGRRPSALALGVAALVIVGAGGAYAAGNGGGTIKACVHHSGGGLYQPKKKCAKHDKKLTWNTKGPQGPKGATGATGAPGPSGDGPGYAYSNATSQTLTGGLTTVAQFNLPAGSYIVNAKAEVSGSATSTGYTNITCTLSGGGGSDTSQFSGPYAPEGLFDVIDGTISAEIPATFTGSGGSVALSCGVVAQNGTSAGSSVARIVVTAVKTTGNTTL